MKRNVIAGLAALAVLGAPLHAAADMIDVINWKLNDGCDLAKFQAIVKDFNAYYKDKDYQAEILLPLHTQNQDAIFWVGRSSSATGFGTAYDHWLAGVAKDRSAVSKLNDRFNACATVTSRSSFMSAP